MLRIEGVSNSHAFIHGAWVAGFAHSVQLLEYNASISLAGQDASGFTELDSPGQSSKSGEDDCLVLDRVERARGVHEHATNFQQAQATSEKLELCLAKNAANRSHSYTSGVLGTAKDGHTNAAVRTLWSCSAEDGFQVCHIDGSLRMVPSPEQGTSHMMRSNSTAILLPCVVSSSPPSSVTAQSVARALFAGWRQKGKFLVLPTASARHGE